MPPEKRTMMETRLRRRLRTLGMATFTQYADFVLDSPDGRGEHLHLVNAITTNKTDFFRELHHFEYLVREIIPHLLRTEGAGKRRPLMLWSAACSSGEEPYSLAMVLGEVAESIPSFNFRILATDISEEVLEKARRAVFSERDVEPIPLHLRRKYLLRSKRKEKQLVKVSPEATRFVRFRKLNLMHEFGFRETMDVVFCRNVLIYFERSAQENLVNRICERLASGGFLMLGHSESINGMDVPLEQVATTIYKVLK